MQIVDSPQEGNVYKAEVLQRVFCYMLFKFSSCKRDDNDTHFFSYQAQ